MSNNKNTLKINHIKEVTSHEQLKISAETFRTA